MPKKFEYVGGGHHDHLGTIYKKGDVAETDHDFEKMFPGMYRKLPDAVVIMVPAPAAAEPEKAPTTPKPEAPKKSEADARGEEVTSAFDVQKGVKVFKRGDLYHAYEGDKLKALNDKGLKKTEVESFVEKYLAE